MGAEKRRKDILQEALDRMKSFGQGISRPTVLGEAFFDDQMKNDEDGVGEHNLTSILHMREMMEGKMFCEPCDAIQPRHKVWAAGVMLKFAVNHLQGRCNMNKVEKYSASVHPFPQEYFHVMDLQIAEALPLAVEILKNGA